MADQTPLSQRSKSQIEADLGATRDRLTGALEGLIGQVHPTAVKQHLADRARGFVQAKVSDAKALVFNARGDLRKDRLMAVGGAGAGALTFFLVVRRIAAGRRRG